MNRRQVVQDKLRRVDMVVDKTWKNVVVVVVVVVGST